MPQLSFSRLHQPTEPLIPGCWRVLICHYSYLRLVPCLMSITWCSWRAASISISSFSRASLMLRSTCSCCCFSISIRAFQRMAYSYSKLPGCANRGGCSRSLSSKEESVNASTKQRGTKKKITVCVQMQWQILLSVRNASHCNKQETSVPPVFAQIAVLLMPLLPPSKNCCY